MNSYIYQIEKREEEKEIKLTFFCVKEDKTIELKEISQNYIIYTEKDKFEALNIKSDSIFLAEKGYKNRLEEKVVKIEIKSKELYEYVLKTLRESKINTYEEDLTAQSRYLIENKTYLIDDDSKYISPKYISLDIETIGLKDHQEIVLISIHSPENTKENKVYVDKSKIHENKLKEVLEHRFEGFELISFDNEKDLLIKFKEDIIVIEPQIIFGWNVIDFDFKVIKERFETHNLEFKFSKYEGDCRLRLYSDFFKNSTMECPGVLIFDAIHILKMNFISFEDYKLDTVAKEVLGDEKIELVEDNEEDSIDDKISAITNLLNKNPIKLIEYNFKDSYLTSAIIEKLKLLELICKRSIITGTPLSRIKSPIATLDIMYLKELHKRGYVAQSNFNFSESNPIEGAFVIEPKMGFYEDVFVLDFKSLYPSIIMTFNIDPFTYKESGQIEAPNGVKFDKERGILPDLIFKLYKERDIAKKEKDSTKSFALKTTMNSFYGAMASPKSRFYNREVGESITAFARHIIKKAKKFVEEKGHKVIYGDTDSIFVQIKMTKEDKSIKYKLERGKELEKEINDYFEKWVQTKYKQSNHLQIEFEKLFTKFFIASKKRYVGYDEISKKTTFTGMEAIRGDWTDLAKRFQIDLVKQMFAEKKKEEIEKFILKYISDLKEGKFDSLLIYKKKTTKPLNMYIKTTPPHVKAARELTEFTGRLVKYVMTKNGPKHIKLIDKDVEYDYEHYIDKQLKGVSDDLLESFGIDFDKLLYSKKQTGLDKFF